MLMKKTQKNTWNTLVVCPGTQSKDTKTHKTHALCICSFEAEGKHKNTHNTYMWWAYVLMGLTTRLQKTYKIYALIIWS